MYRIMGRRMEKIKIITIFFLFLCLQLIQASTTDGTVDSFSVEISSLVKPNKVPLNQTLDYIIQITWGGNLSQIEIEDVEEPAFSNFEIIGTASSNRISGTADGKISTREIRYTLQPKTLGMGYIEPSRLTYKDVRDEQNYDLYTQRIPVEVLPAVAMPGEKPFPWLILVIVIFIGGSAVVGFILYRKQFKKTSEETLPQVPLEERMLGELKEKIDLKNPDRNGSIRLLSKLYRSYLAEKFNISALEATTQDLIQSLKGMELEEGLIVRSETLFQKADLIKFSGKTATQAELDEAYITVETVLETQQKQNL